MPAAAEAEPGSQGCRLILHTSRNSLKTLHVLGFEKIFVPKGASFNSISIGFLYVSRIRQIVHAKKKYSLVWKVVIIGLKLWGVLQPSKENKMLCSNKNVGFYKHSVHMMSNVYTMCWAPDYCMQSAALWHSIHSQSFQKSPMKGLLTPWSCYRHCQVPERLDNLLNFQRVELRSMIFQRPNCFHCTGGGRL